MTDAEIAKRLASEMRRLGMSDIELAAMTGLSLPTATALRRGRAIPSTTRARRAVESFLERAANAMNRGHLRLP